MRKLTFCNFIKIFLLSLVVVMSVSCGDSPKKILTGAVEDINKHCPLAVDTETRLDNVELVGDKELQYNYTLINVIKGDEFFDHDIFVETMIPYMHQSINSAAFAFLRNLEVTVIHSYDDIEGNNIWTYTITPDMYK